MTPSPVPGGGVFDAHERSRWAGRAVAFERGYAHLCAHPADALLDEADVAPGRPRETAGAATRPRVLDVGTGTGTVAALACDRGAEVTGVDADTGMAELAVVRVPGAAFTVAALPSLPFRDAAFDAAVANFVINHVGEPARAVAELRRIVRPGGRVAVTVWPSPAPVAQALWGRIFADAGVPAEVSAPRVADEHNFARTCGGLSGLLTAAGLTGVQARELTWTHRVDVDDWWSGPANGLATPGLILERLPAADVTRVRRSFDRVLASFRDGNGLLALPTAAILGSGRG